MATTRPSVDGDVRDLVPAGLGVDHPAAAQHQVGWRSLAHSAAPLRHPVVVRRVQPARPLPLLRHPLT